MLELLPTKGKLLIADPSLNDQAFGRSVILLTEHNENGSVGFILNKPLGFSLQDLLPEVNFDSEVYNGGPVEQDSLYFVHKVPELIPDSVEISNGIYWGGDFNIVKELINSGKISSDSIKFFLGYSGWSAKQLLNELKEDSWLISKQAGDKSLFMLKAKTLWKNQMNSLGGKYKLWANAPFDPSLN